MEKGVDEEMKAWEGRCGKGVRQGWERVKREIWR